MQCPIESPFTAKTVPLILWRFEKNMSQNEKIICTSIFIKDQNIGLRGILSTFIWPALLWVLINTSVLYSPYLEIRFSTYIILTSLHMNILLVTVLKRWKIDIISGNQYVHTNKYLWILYLSPKELGLWKLYLQSAN